MRLEADFETDEGNWVKAEAKRRGITVTQIFRFLALEERKRVEVEKAKRAKPLRERFLDFVRENFSIVRGLTDLAITQKQYAEWNATPEFKQQLKAAQIYWVDGIQQEMADIGRGKKKGDPNALGWLLNAHHPAYGRAKIELMLKIIDPLIKRLKKFLVEELGPSQEAGIKRALERFELEKRKRLSDMT